jgi:hypothetical protein
VGKPIAVQIFLLPAEQLPFLFGFVEKRTVVELEHTITILNDRYFRIDGMLKRGGGGGVFEGALVMGGGSSESER